VSSAAELLVSWYVQAKQPVWVLRLTTLKMRRREDVLTEEEDGKCCPVNISLPLGRAHAWC